MKYFIRITCACLFLLSCGTGHTEDSLTVDEKGYMEEKKAIEEYVNAIMGRYQIPGVAMAIVKNGKVIYRKNHGFANLPHKVPVSDSTVFRLYSLTKPFIAVGIFQLLEAGELSLDDPVSRYIDDLPGTWNNIQIKHLLTHSSGLPDMAPLFAFQELTEDMAKTKAFDQPLRFKAGEKYDYNQTGFWILQKIIEKVSGSDLEEFMDKNQFGTIPKSDGVLFSSDSRDIVRNRATPYFYFNKGKLATDLSYLQGRYLFAANGLNMNIHAFVEWVWLLDNDKLINTDTKQQMWSSFEYTDSPKKFCYGWDRHDINGHVSYGFSGSFVTAYRTFPDDDLSIIFLSNGLGSWYNIDNTVNHIASLLDADFAIPENDMFESLLHASITKDFTRFKDHYNKQRHSDEHQNIDFESQLNDVAYMLLNLQKNRKAIEIFRLNTVENPNSWNVWDSLGEGYERSGDIENAILNYRRSVKVNPGNQHGIERIKLLELGI